MLLSVGENIATIFTFLTFILIILAPMVMAFIRTKDRSGKKQETQKKESKKPLKKPSNLLYDLLRRVGREDEPEVRFTTPGESGSSGGSDISEKGSAEKPQLPRREAAGRKSAPALSRPLESNFRDFDKELGEPFDDISSGSYGTYGTGMVPGGMTAGTAPRGGNAGIPDTPATRRLISLPELQRAVVLAELLGPPRALREEDPPG